MWHVWRTGESKDRVLAGRPEGNKQLGRPTHRRDDNIKINLQEMRWGHRLDLSGSGYGQMVGACEHGNEPSATTKCREFIV